MIINPGDIQIVGIVGLGFMGSSMAAAFSAWGYQVVALSPVPSETDRQALQKIGNFLRDQIKRGKLNGDLEDYLKRIEFSSEYSSLRKCDLIIESVIEDFEVKKQVFNLIENNISAHAILGSNTSAIPINDLQSLLTHPKRFVGLHWSEPAMTTHFLEIIQGQQSDAVLSEKLYKLAEERWNKEPTLVKKDIRGFITNRLMYALYREAIHLVAEGYATVEDIDKACRNDAGRWMSFCGPFRYMDLTGVQAYYKVMKDLFPVLTQETGIPDWVKLVVSDHANGISTGKGFYHYAPEEVDSWEQAFAEFGEALETITEKYPPVNLRKK